MTILLQKYFVMKYFKFDTKVYNFLFESKFLVNLFKNSFTFWILKKNS